MTKDEFHESFQLEVSTCSCYQELLMRYMMYGYEITDDDNLWCLRQLFNKIRSLEYGIDHWCNDDCYQTLFRFSSLINEMIVECDIINDNNAEEFAIEICYMILKSKMKKNLMNSFSFMCKKYPCVMKKEYERQKNMNMYM